MSCDNICELMPAVNVSIPAHPGKDYGIYIKKGLLSLSGELIRLRLNSRNAYILSDDTVFALYGDVVVSSLSNAGFEVFKYVIPHGETSKSAENLIALLNKMAHDRMTRSDCVVALGGGVVGDLAGFAAAIYQRGIPFVQIPTTLLAMVDSSVGGKTAIDLEEGKNLAGVFHQPELVICDPNVLSTLPSNIFSDGCAEVIKYSMICDSKLFLKLHEPLMPQIDDIIKMCIEDKRKLVEEDETDKGSRQLLNLGHTVGHAIEACSDYEISHGSAVAIGMAVITRAAEKNGICPVGTLDALLKLIERYDLPVSCPFSAEELFTVATADKKRDGKYISVVLPYGISDSRLIKIPIEKLLDYFKAGLLDQRGI